MAIDNDKLPWLHDINVFMTPISHVNWNSIAVNSLYIRNGVCYSNPAGVTCERSYDLVFGAGSWTIEILARKESGAAIVSVYLNSALVGNLDLYSSSALYNQLVSASFTITAPGKRRLTLRTESKNASSSGYIAWISHLRLYRTA